MKTTKNKMDFILNVTHDRIKQCNENMSINIDDGHDGNGSERNRESVRCNEAKRTWITLYSNNNNDENKKNNNNDRNK